MAANLAVLHAVCIRTGLASRRAGEGRHHPCRPKLKDSVIPEQRVIRRILRFEFGPALSDTDNHRPIEPLVWPNGRAEVRCATEVRGDVGR